MQAEQDKTYTIGDEELAIVANALWTDGVHVEFEDIQTACRRYPGDLTTVTAKLREWVRQGKPTGTFCELSEEEHFRSVVEACDARPESWELALRVTKKFPQVPLGVTVNIALLIDGLDVIPQEDCDMIPFLSQLTMGKLSQILELLRVPKPKGNKQVWLEVVAGLCAQSSIIRKTVRNRTIAGRRILSSCSFTVLEVLLSTIVLSAAQVLPQSSAGIAVRASRKACGNSRFVMCCFWTACRSGGKSPSVSMILLDPASVLTVPSVVIFRTLWLP